MQPGILFTNSRIIKILMNGFMGVAALTIGGSLFAMLRSLPLGDWYTNFLISTGLFDILNFPIMITSELISLYLVLSFGYFTAKSYDKNAFSGAMISLGAFLILTPFEMTATLTDEAGTSVTGVVSGVLPIGSFGATGIFLSMIVGIGAARIYTERREDLQSIKLTPMLLVSFYALLLQISPALSICLVP